MPVIKLQTIIYSDLEKCFDLSTSIDLHIISTARTNEKAIAGKTSGLIHLEEQVTWQARHFGISQKLTSKITQYRRPFHFRDEQVKGAFSKFSHDHNFRQQGNYVVMEDIFDYKSPLGMIGKAFNKIILTAYLTKLLTKRNLLIKEYAETDKWKTVLTTSNRC